MKKILSISLVLIFSYSFIGFYLNFAIEQYLIKEEIKERLIHDLPDSELTLLKFSSLDSEKITWVEEGKEFRYEGTMFDVVKIERGCDTACYYCFCDSKESKLLSNLDRLVKEQSGHSQSKTLQKKRMINIFLHEVLSSPVLPFCTVHYHMYEFSYHFVKGDVITPPPRSQATV